DGRNANHFEHYSLMSSPAAQMNEWLAEHADLSQKIVIPASLKWEIRDKLDQANITERVLFPGLDGLSRWLKRYYSPRVSTDASKSLASSRNKQGDASVTPTDHRIV